MFDEELVRVNRAIDKYWRHTSNRHYRIPKVIIEDKKIIRSTSPVMFTKDCMDFVKKVHRLYINKVGYYRGHGDSSQPQPICFLFGQKGSVVSTAKLVISPRGGGCGNMPSLFVSDINKVMYELTKEGYFTAGIGRIGVFKSITHHERGNGLHDLSRILGDQGIFMLSLARSSFSIEFPNNDKRFIPNSYTILKKGGEKNGKSNKRNNSKARVTTRCKTNNSRNNTRRVLKKK